MLTLRNVINKIFINFYAFIKRFWFSISIDHPLFSLSNESLVTSPLSGYFPDAGVASKFKIFDYVEILS